jgi:hypothetical protein
MALNMPRSCTRSRVSIRTEFSMPSPARTATSRVSSRIRDVSARFVIASARPVRGLRDHRRVDRGPRSLQSLGQLRSGDFQVAIEPG